MRNSAQIEALVRAGWDAPADPWYAMSYPVIVDRFSLTRTRTLSSQVERTLLVGAWVQTILNPALSLENIQGYRDLVDRWVGQDLWLLEADDFNELIAGHRELLRRTNMLLNTADGSNYPTISKQLHFEAPSLFPILDQNVGRAIDAPMTPANNPTQFTQRGTYGEYLQRLRESDPAFVGELRERAAGSQISALRLIDIALFNAGA